jgi:hypothetical protein
MFQLFHDSADRPPNLKLHASGCVAKADIASLVVRDCIRAIATKPKRIGSDQTKH